MTPISLSSITYSQGLQLLAARKQALDSGHIPRMSKEAMATSFPLRDIGADYVEKIAESGLLDSLKSGFGGMDASTRNVLLSGLAGAGLGAGTGAASALLSGEEGAGWKALKGGLAGGAVGGGLGLAFNPEVLSKAFKLEKSPGLTSSALPANASNAQHRAAQIKSRTPAEQLDEINKLQGVADSSMPETINYAAHGLNTAAAGGAGAYIANKAVYDPDTLAMGIKAKLQDPKLELAAFQSVFPTANPKTLTIDELKAMMPKSPIPGTIPSTLNSKLSAGLGDAGEKILEKSKIPGMLTGVGKLRPGKAALLALLAGGWGLGAGAIRHNYRQGDSDRTDAKAVLNALRTTVLPDQTANTMQ